MSHILFLTLSLYAVWFMLSGHLEPLLLVFGLVSSAFVATVAGRMDVVDHEAVPVHVRPGRLLGYLLWLLAEVARANVEVARCVLNPRLPVAPTMGRVPAGPLSRLGLVIYANSITLTPGTICVDVEDDAIVVHALRPETLEGLQSGVMARRVARLEG